MSLLKIATLIAAGFILAAPPPCANASEIWLSPTDNVTQHGEDFPRFFSNPQSWQKTAKEITVFSIPVNYLLRTPPATVKPELEWLRSHGIKLSVQLAALPVDKHVCGDGVEGMTWPHEAAVSARKLKALGAEVDFFALDLPLTNGHLSRRAKACRLSIQETAEHLVTAVRELRQQYPNARLIDLEVPTGIPLSEWSATLAEWLSDFKQASGEQFYGLTMDAWWKFDWKDAARETARILSARGIRTGIFLNAIGGPHATARDWIVAARQNACDLRSTRIPLDYVVVSNWFVMDVRNLPETDPLTLTGLLDWFAGGGTCAP